MNCTAVAPSPTPAATRLTEPCRTSPFANRGCHPFDEPVPHVSGREDSRLAGFKPVRVAIELPFFGEMTITIDLRKIRTRGNESVIIAPDDVFKPVGVRKRANKNE